MVLPPLILEQPIVLHLVGNLIEIYHNILRQSRKISILAWYSKQFIDALLYVSLTDPSGTGMSTSARASDGVIAQLFQQGYAQQDF